MANEQSGVFMEDGYVLRQPPYNDRIKLTLNGNYTHVGTGFESPNNWQVNENTIGASFVTNTVYVPFAGNYLVKAHINWIDINSSTVFQLRLVKTGQNIRTSQKFIASGPPSNNDMDLVIVEEMQLNKNDFIRIDIASSVAGRVVIGGLAYTAWDISLLSKNEATP